MKIKTSKLIGTALDWAVAKCKEKIIYQIWPEQINVTDSKNWYKYEPSTNWSQGGPIINSIKGFELKQWLKAKAETCCEAHIHNYDGDWIQFGPTPLIAAMRCYVASKLGDEIEIPKELL